MAVVNLSSANTAMALTSISSAPPMMGPLSSASSVSGPLFNKLCDQAVVKAGGMARVDPHANTTALKAINKLQGNEFDNAMNEFFKARVWTKEDEAAKRNASSPFVIGTAPAGPQINRVSNRAQAMEMIANLKEKLTIKVQQNLKLQARIAELEQVCDEQHSEAMDLANKCMELEAENAKLRKRKAGSLQPMDDELWRRVMRYG